MTVQTFSAIDKLKGMLNCCKVTEEMTLYVFIFPPVILCYIVLAQWLLYHVHSIFPPNESFSLGSSLHRGCQVLTLLQISSWSLADRFVDDALAIKQPGSFLKTYLQA